MTHPRTLQAFPVAALALFLLAGCTGGDRVTIQQAGSSTVLPIAEAWAEEFGGQIGAQVVVSGGGTGSGIQRFCRGEIQIADASRPIKQAETDACAKNGIAPFEVQVAVDGLSVVVAKSNTFVDCLTVKQLNAIWTGNKTKQVNTWNQVNPAWPDQRIELYGPGTDSGTYDYFREAVIHPFDGSTASTRSDYTPSEDDNVLVTGVASSPNALGYFGLAYYEENAARLKVVKVDQEKGDGCVEPTAQDVESGKYAPLSRPLLMYVDGKPTGAIKAYFERGLSQQGQDLVADEGYIPLPMAKRTEMLARLA